jgi:putative ABC transport system substrate-binding protein
VFDPVGAGIAASLAEPGGNLTGIRAGGYLAKFLELIPSILPEADHMLVFHNPDNMASVLTIDELQQAAPEAGINLVLVEGSTLPDFQPTLDEVPENIEIIVSMPGAASNEIVTYAAQAGYRHQIPVVTASPMDENVLFFYGVDLYNFGVQAAPMADRILRGADPASTPIENPDLYLKIDLSVADALDIEISDAVLSLADEIVRE